MFMVLSALPVEQMPLGSFHGVEALLAADDGLHAVCEAME
jgi:hypothetical protein